MSQDPFQVILEQLMSALPMAPASYRYRLIAQFVLCGLLFISSCIYTVLYFVHARRRGQQFWLVRLQQPWEATSLLKSKHNSKRIVLNNLPFCSILMIAASIGLAIGRWKEWVTYVDFDPHEQMDKLSSSFLTYIPLSLHCWAFTQGNLAATLNVKERMGSYKTILNRSIFQNLLLLGYPIALWTALIPCVIIANTKENQVTSLFLQCIGLLTAGSTAYQAGQPVAEAAVAEVQDLLATLIEVGHEVEKLITIISYICAVSMIILLLVNSYTFVLLLVLRRQVQRNQELKRSRRGLFDLPTLERYEMEAYKSPLVVQATAQSSQLHALASKIKIHESGGSLPTASESISTATNQSRDRAGPSLVDEQHALALKRLTTDLYISIPAVTLSCTLLAAGALLVSIRRAAFTSWAAFEFTNDSVSYTYLVLSSTMVLLCTVNLIRSWGDPVLLAAENVPNPADSESSGKCTSDKREPEMANGRQDLSWQDCL